MTTCRFVLASAVHPVIAIFNVADFGRATEQFGIAVLPPGEAVKRLEKRS